MSANDIQQEEVAFFELQLTELKAISDGIESIESIESIKSIESIEQIRDRLKRLSHAEFLCIQTVFASEYSDLLKKVSSEDGLMSPLSTDEKASLVELVKKFEITDLLVRYKAKLLVNAAQLSPIGAVKFTVGTGKHPSLSKSVQEDPLKAPLSQNNPEEVLDIKASILSKIKALQTYTNNKTKIPLGGVLWASQGKKGAGLDELYREISKINSNELNNVNIIKKLANAWKADKKAHGFFSTQGKVREELLCIANLLPSVKGKTGQQQLEEVLSREGLSMKSNTEKAKDWLQGGRKKKPSGS